MRVLVDGSRNPELIPDQRAVRMLMLQLASSPDGARRARLAQSAFSDADLAALTAALVGVQGVCHVWTAQQAMDAGMPPQYDAASRVINANHQNGGAGGAIPNRVDQLVLVVEAFAINWMDLWGCTILTPATCQVAQGVARTNQIDRIEIDVQELVMAATAAGWNVLESARWIIGHEVGHGVNMAHGPPVPPNTPSLMTEWLSAAPTGAWITYTQADLQQIRLHDRLPPS